MVSVYVSRETLAGLDVYEALLKTWNPRINLISCSDQGAGLRDRHFNDSLSLVPHLPPGVHHILDLGSGGGLPAIPVAIATGLRVDMVEADRRKAAFLQTAAATLGLAGKVWCERAETTTAPTVSCITARALAPLNTLLRLASRLLTPEGTALFLKGPNAEEEIESAALNWHMVVELHPGNSPRSQIVQITQLRQAHDGSGRAPGSSTGQNRRSR